MKKFEYKQETTVISMETLNEIGKEGWELIYIDTEKKVYLFKREVITKFKASSKDLLLDSYNNEE